MPVDDRSRLNLHRKLEAVLGDEEADQLMAHLPPVTWNQVATKDDIATLGATVHADMQALATELRGEIAGLRTELRSEMHTEIGGLRTEIAELRTEMHTEIGRLRTEMHTEIGGLRTEIGELRTEMRTEIGGLRTEMHTEIGGLRTEMQVGFATLRADFVEGTNRHIKWLVTFAAAWTSVLVAAVRLVP
jgi:phage host-nuclease inhibitor protein Gam